MMFWIITGVLVALFAMFAWWSSGRAKPDTRRGPSP